MGYELMMVHAGDARCICTDGHAEHRDVAWMCDGMWQDPETGELRRAEVQEGGA